MIGSGITAARALRHLIVSLSFAGLGVAIYLVCANVWLAFTRRRSTARYLLAVSAIIAGAGIISGVITFIVWGEQVIDPNLRTVVYTFGAFLFLIGVVGYAFERRRVNITGDRREGGP